MQKLRLTKHQGFAQGQKQNLNSNPALINSNAFPLLLIPNSTWHSQQETVNSSVSV